MDQQINPLQKYFRLPGVHIKLPSNGRFQDAGNINLTATGELPIMAMRAQDELLMKSPDALMSGMAIEEVIKSCCPAIKDPRQLPSPDVDAILLGIRASTYGEMMTIESECPHCGAENAYEFNINGILDTVAPLEDEYLVRLSDELNVYLRPFNLHNSTKASSTVFQETRKLQLLDNLEVSDDERQSFINQSYKVLNDMNVQMIAECVERVVTPGGTVTERQFIDEFIHNIDLNQTHALENKLKEINEAGINKKHSVTCSQCSKTWETIVEFDPANFFGQGS